MTAFTMRCIKGDLLSPAPMFRRCSSSRVPRQGTGAIHGIPVRPSMRSGPMHPSGWLGSHERLSGTGSRHTRLTTTLFLCCTAKHRELPQTVCIFSATEWNSGRTAMPSGSAHEFEDFARDCVRLAEQADTPELREKLLNLAREWMRAVMDQEDIVTNSQAAE